MTIRVVLEIAPKRTFASAIDWPGWSRSGRDEEAALATLLDYAPRYAEVARRAKIAFPAARSTEVVERLTGGGGTEFGVPGTPAASEDEPISRAQLKRLLGLLRASWETFDAAAASAGGKSLRLGPRGGGRQVPKIIDHVRDAEAAYVSSLGSRPPPAPEVMSAQLMARLRDAFVDTVTARATGKPLPDPRNTKRPWSPRYAVRRAAWHVLDHAWEIEDRAS